MKIKKVNELSENKIYENNEKIQNFKKIISDVYGDDASFPEYWDKNADRIIQEIGLLDKDSEESQTSNEDLPIDIKEDSYRRQQNGDITIYIKSNHLKTFKKTLEESGINYEIGLF